MVNLNRAAPPLDPTRTGSSARSVLYTLAAMTLIAALAGLGLAYGIKAWLDQSATEDHAAPLTETHSVAIGAQRYAIPASLLTDPSQRRDGFAERIDMTLALPIGPAGQLSEVDLTLMPRGRMRTSANLLDTVYLHQFSGSQLSGVPGLVGKPLEPNVGTSEETVWYDPLSANPFTAKCMTPVQMTPGVRSCLRVFMLSDRNTAIVTFDPAALGNWRSFDATIENAMAMLRL